LPGLVGDKEPAKEQAGRESYVKARRILLKPVVNSVDGLDRVREARCRAESHASRRPSPSVQQPDQFHLALRAGLLQDRP
jgi:hypothetical protein